MEIVLDTNFIITCVKWNLDFESLANALLDEPLEWTLLEGVLRELRELPLRIGEREEDKRAALTSIDVLKNMKAFIVKSKSSIPIDDQIVQYVQNRKCLLATMDKHLKKRVSVPFLSVRARKKLAIV